MISPMKSIFNVNLAYFAEIATKAESEKNIHDSI